MVLPYEEVLRRRPPPVAETGSRSRASGRRVQAGNPRRRMREPRLVTGRPAGDSRTGHAQATGLIAGRGTDPQLPYEELLRRRPPPAAETGSRSRANGRRVQAGNPRRRIREPRLVTGRRVGGFVRAIKEKPLKFDVLTSDFGGFSFAFTLHTSALPHFLFQVNDADKT